MQLLTSISIRLFNHSFSVSISGVIVKSRGLSIAAVVVAKLKRYSLELGLRSSPSRTSFTGNSKK
jgi:hypothetical protein